MDGSLVPGDRLMAVNEVNLENGTLDQAVQALKGAPRGTVRIVVAKPLPLPEIGESSTDDVVSYWLLSKCIFETVFICLFIRSCSLSMVFLYLFSKPFWMITILYFQFLCLALGHDSWYIVTLENERLCKFLCYFKKPIYLFNSFVYPKCNPYTPIPFTL